MKILIDITHPAHVHLFRNLAFELKRRGHKVFWTARDKDVTRSLLKYYKVRFRIISKARSSLIGLARELLEHDYGMYKIARRYNFDLLLGGCSASVTHIGKLVKTRSIVFNDDDAKYVRIFASLSYPFADTIVTPDCLRDDGFGQKLVKHKSYHALAYLHPTRFSPNPKVIESLGCSSSERYFLLRFVSLKAAHDIGHTGIKRFIRKKLIGELSKLGRVFISTEGRIEEEFKQYLVTIPPQDIHDVLYYATMFIGDSQTMTAEAAVLGTPAIRCNTFVGKISYLEELEHTYGLTFGFLPSDGDKMLNRIKELLSMEGLSKEWQRRREKMLADKIDLTSWMVEFVENYPKRIFN